MAQARRGATARTIKASGGPASLRSSDAVRVSRPRKTRSAGDATRERIMRTAQKLFAARGIDAVSLNEIVSAAKVNTAAIHYHFRSKDGLIEAILHRSASDLGERREAILNDLESRGDISLRDLVRAMVEPITTLRDTPGGLDYARFLAWVSLHPRYSAYLAEVTARYTTRFLNLLERLTPDLSSDVRLRRFAYARTFVYDAIATDDRTVEVWMKVHGERTDQTAATNDLIDLLTGGLAAPQTTPPRASSRRLVARRTPATK
jgi:AcrR family transcriptional regulator